MNILYGLFRPDEGRIFLDGQPVQFHSPRDAIACGIGMVHQHFMLVPTLTVVENVILGMKRRHCLRVFGKELRIPVPSLSIKKAADKIASLSECFGLTVDPYARVSDLSVGSRQRVEIIKALYREAKLLILDEPTSVLTPQETSDFFRFLKTFVQQGMSIIFITHKLQEVMASGNRATVLRQGAVVGTVDVADITQRELAYMMVGRGVLEQLDKQPQAPEKPILQVEALTYESPQHLPVVNQVSLTVHAGEILGIAGVSGNGQSELAEMLSGLRAPSSGQILLNGQQVTHASPRLLNDAGLSHIPEERQQVGVVMDLPLHDNAILGSFFGQPFSRFSVLNRDHNISYAQSLLVTYDVKANRPTVAVHELSGGNQQKFVVGRELARKPAMLLAAQPTRGVDIGSTEYIHQQLLEQRAQGVAILLISTELDEIFALSDRIGVMHNGRLVDILPADTADRQTIGLLMAGGREH
jgi:simple sugar transport system ATP-binding protein